MLRIVEVIEELGFDVVVDSVISLDEKEIEYNERVVEIRIDGLYCDFCLVWVVNCFGGF